MNRYLTLAPPAYDLEQLRNEARSLWPNVRDVNVVGDMIAIYLDAEADPSDLTAWGSTVAAHVPAPPPVDPLVALAHAIVDAQTLDDVKPVAAQILSDAGVQP